MQPALAGWRLGAGRDDLKADVMRLIGRDRGGGELKVRRRSAEIIIAGLCVYQKRGIFPQRPGCAEAGYRMLTGRAMIPSDDNDF
jgi:hypothetical protein